MKRVVLCVAAVTLACTAPRSSGPETLAGKYVGRFPDGSETLTLAKDGRFDETFVFPDNKVRSNHGTWSENRTPERTVVRLAGALVRPFDANARVADWQFKVVETKGGIQLELEDDPDGSMVLVQSRN